MRILITNDDGINAPGLQALLAIADDLTTEDKIHVVAPAFEQSGVGHCISYTRPLMVSYLPSGRVAVDGSPADCVIAGLYEVLNDTKPDLILSGVNRGNNSAENTLYSGTIGATIEGALQRIPSIALSQYYGPENVTLEDPFEAARSHGAATVRKILEAGFDNDAPYGLFYNVNFPPVPAADVKGTRVVPQGVRPGVHFSAKTTQAPNGRNYLWIGGGDQRTPTAPDTDGAANLDGYISVTPMRADLTAHDQLAHVAQAFKD
ncbi:5'/3'-nucleotidase SurE [Shimia ponticola]|uniref:5'/3'-nucleotidase SurE n=1 Tax=Shimia ponticola TaxID=2582893 RepID=UPI0011BF1240|nr:5'/3'-nucleotidase SurE [Shimia ponticola]